MLNLTKDDKHILDISYKSFLSNLKTIFQTIEINNGLNIYKIINYMLKNGLFCSNKDIKYDTTFTYLSLSNLDYLGTQVMYGTCCCRHISSLVNDILQTLGLDSSLLYIFIKEDGAWQKCNPEQANHMTILLKDNNQEYILDPFNDFILKKDKDQNLESITPTTISIPSEIFRNYSDPNINKIEKVLKKYYTLQNQGINFIYDYSY